MSAFRQASFRVGQKEIYLPKFAIALLRQEGGNPYHARFRVPLWFSKLDIRDYLWHAYGVEISAVRSYVKLRPVQQGDGRSPRPQNHVSRWHRPRSHKYMTVEMTEPFIWPKDNSDEPSFGKESLKAQDKDSEDQQKRSGPTSDTERADPVHVSKMREQAQALLLGKTKWAAPRDSDKLRPFTSSR